MTYVHLTFYFIPAGGRIVCILAVLPIWEGTSTVMSLDVLRAIQKSKGNVLNSLFNEIRNRLTSLEPELNDAAKDGFKRFLIGWNSADQDGL